MTPRDHLHGEPYDFDFFQAVRLMERIDRDTRPIGLRKSQPAEEVVRLRPHLSLSFPPSQIVELLPPSEDRPTPLMTVAFFGLYGINGALPVHYTSMMLDLVRDTPRTSPERRSLRDWLDLFNHRLLSLFYRAWEKYRFYIPYERGEPWAAETDSFTLAIRSLMGLGSRGHRDRFHVQTAAGGVQDEHDWEAARRSRHTALAQIDDLALLYYAGFFAQPIRNPTNLRAMLADYFQLPTEICQFQGCWLPIPEDRQTQVGVLGSLGVDAIAGSQVYDVTSRFRVRLGPLTYAQFEDLLPDPAAIRERKTFFLVTQLARLYAGPELDFDVQLVLEAEEVPGVFLGDLPGAGPRLGWNAWLISRTPDAPADDAVFEAGWVTTV